MVNQSYYRLADNSGSNVEVLDKFLIVNCVGVYGLSTPFDSRNPYGRRDIYLMYLISGKMDIEINGNKCKLNAGDIALYPAFKPYHYTKTDDDDLQYYWLHFSGYGAEEMLSSCGFKQGFVYTIGIDDKVISSFQHMFQYFYSYDSLFEIEASAQLTKIFVQMARTLKSDSSVLLDKSTNRIRTSLGYLYCNYTKPITLSQLAELEYLSDSRYSAVFKQCMGISPQGFLINLRMKNAADLMRKTDLSIKQIAKIVGYDDPLYFSVLFKRKLGITPSQYQNE